jgi:putative MFS transporter
MARYGVTIEKGEGDAMPVEAREGSPASGRFAEMATLFERTFLSRTVVVLLYGLGWGIVNWGFITFLPMAMQDAGFEAGRASGLLFQSSMIAVPGTILVAYLYGLWSSKRTMIVYAVATGMTLVAFALLDPTSGGNHLVLIGLVVALLVGSGGMISMLSPYTAEVYPTRLRGTGSGFAAASSKVGGVFGPPVVASLLAATGAFTIPALVAAVPVTLAAVVLARGGFETRGRRLEEISSLDGR